MTTEKKEGCLFLGKKNQQFPVDHFFFWKNKTNVWENTSQWSEKGKEKNSVSQQKRDTKKSSLLCVWGKLNARMHNTRR